MFRFCVHNKDGSVEIAYKLLVIATTEINVCLLGQVYVVVIQLVEKWKMESFAYLSQPSMWLTSERSKLQIVECNV